MPEAIGNALLDFQTVPTLLVLVRLLVALALGMLIAVLYRATRPSADIAPSFPGTLVLMCVLIAMVTQVIGDNVARAFSLVGALSIVRFRTVVRDTQDTAFVVFAVGVGMAIGAGNPWLAALGLAVVAIAAFSMRSAPDPRPSTSVATPRAVAEGRSGPGEGEAFELVVRVGIGHDPQVLVAPALDAHVQEHTLMSLATARQGLAVDATFLAALSDACAADALIRALNTIDGVQSVTLQRVVEDDDD